MSIQTHVLIIGGGATGTGLARDLALRGVSCVLVEKRDINAGASGGNHGLLHSGARYVAGDSEAAMECRAEGKILKEIAPQCIENTGGLFVAVAGDDENYVADFPSMCRKSHIPYKEISPDHARELEPCLSKNVIRAFEVEDGAIDPFMLSLDNLAHAVSLGCRVIRNARVTGFVIEGRTIRSARLVDETSGNNFQVQAELVVNAAGAWAGTIAAMAGAEIHILHSMGSLLVTQDRLAGRVINRLRKAADADILVPGGTVSILGTTSVPIDDPDTCRPTIPEADRMIEDATAMIPVLATTRYIRAYAGVRPLVFHGHGTDGRSLSRGFSLIDHARDHVDNFVSITGGKLTTYRLMAEKTADMVCRKLGIDAPCTTRTTPLPASSQGHWTEPGFAPRSWIRDKADDDLILCECEMVSRKGIDHIIKDMDGMRGRSLLTAIGLRSRVGKGPCQGGFCGLRVTGHLYDRGHVAGDQGIRELKSFIERRWQGFSPILWDLPLMQAELQEALYCGMLDLELLNQEQDREKP
jgi:glycerol-3-phosphate dehydrogenase